MKGLVLQGINNIYLVKTDQGIFQSRIKGKVLKDIGNVYNPIASGDEVLLEIDTDHTGHAMILERLPRKSYLGRWNKKRRSEQIIAANLDCVVCVLSPESPPFRPRFADRVLVSCELGGVEPLIVLNKIDQGISDRVMDRLNDFKRIGYEILLCSAQTGEGLDILQDKIQGKVSAFTGQSGVGKSTILNGLIPGVDLRTAGITEKYNRGKHTTCFAIALEKDPETTIIDTPGIRELEVCGVDSTELSHYFREMEPLINECSYNGCTHTHEPGCQVLEALEKGLIHQDRYQSYTTIFEDLKERERVSYGSS